MKKNALIGVGVIAAIIIIIAFFGLALGPPTFANEALVRRGPIAADWSVTFNETTVSGTATWTKFAYYADESIKLYRSIYWGAILFTEEGINWIDDQDQLQEKALTLNNLTARWQYNGQTVPTTQQNGSSTFKFVSDNHDLRVTFSIPIVDGNYKFSSLDDAWSAGELYLTVTEW